MGHIAAAEPHPRRSTSFVLRLVVEIVIACIGSALLICVIVANQRWLDRHFVPSFFLPRHTYVLLETVARVVMAIAGFFLLFGVRQRAGRFAAQAPRRTFEILIAIALAMGASNLVLGYVHLRPVEWLSANEEPRREPDAHLGWTWVPGRTGQKKISGRIVDYAVDTRGYRVQRVDEPIDVARPTVLFIGESVMFGEGLTWEESIPGQVGSILGIQTANLAVHGYGNDQAYMRLQTELSRFRLPVAIVSLFMTDLFGRNLDQDRPHLGPGLVWLPPEHRSRLASLAKLLVPYRANSTVDRGVEVTREVFGATVKLAHSHGATPLIVVLQFGQEDQQEQILRRRILDDPGLAYLFVEIDSTWRLPWDRHPNAHAAHAIAAAIAARLQATTPYSSNPRAY